jgi:hypothetical protein
MAFYMKGSPYLNKVERKSKKARKTLQQIEEMQDKRQTKTRINSKVSRIDDEGVKTSREKRKQEKLNKTLKQI